MRCLICGGDTTPFYDEKMVVESYHCGSCSTFFKSPQTHQSIAAQKARYDLHTNDEADAGYRAYFQRFLDFVLPYAGRPETALDFGCGRSTLLAALLGERGVACDAYDPLYHPDTAYHTKKYDLIVSTEVFEHLHDPKAVFEMLLERVNRGGYLAIQTQFHANSIEAYQHWYYRQDPTHIVFFRPETFRWLCREYGCHYVADNGKNMVIVKKEN